MSTLLSKAKAFQPKRPTGITITDDVKEVVRAWLRGELRLAQVSVAIYGEHVHGSRVYSLIARTAREMVCEGGKI